MNHDKIFDTQENQRLTAICVRSYLSDVGFFGIIWGIINIAIGIDGAANSNINILIIVMGAIMLLVGVRAKINPQFKTIMHEAVIMGMLLVWNIGITILDSSFTAKSSMLYIVLPIILLSKWIIQYKRLKHLKELIDSVHPLELKEMKEKQKILQKMNIKKEPLIVETTDKLARGEISEDSIFFIQKKLSRAFIVSKEDIKNAIEKHDSEKLKMSFKHPVGEFCYYFNKANSDKIKEWIY